MAWSRLQSASNAIASGTTVPVTFSTANLSSGSTLIAVVTGNGIVTTSSVKDGAGNSFIQIASIIALRECQKETEQIRDVYQRRRDVLGTTVIADE